MIPRTRLAREAAQRAFRTLLQRPLLTHEDGEGFLLVLRHAEALRPWLAEHLGWGLVVEPGLVRLVRSPSRDDAGHPAVEVRPGAKAGAPFTRRRYVLLCLALAVLETEGRQTTLRRLMEAVQGQLAADPYLAAEGMAVDAQRREDRADLVAVGRLLLHWRVLSRIDGEEEGFLARTGDGAGDVLYAIHRAVLARLPGWLASPAIIGGAAAGPAHRRAALHPRPQPLDPADPERLRQVRQTILARLLEGPVLLARDLDPVAAAVLAREGGRLAALAAEATGLIPEIRAEGIALADAEGDLVDLPIGQEGTDGHATLLVADLLNARRRAGSLRVPRAEVEQAVVAAAAVHVGRWREDARDGDGARRLAHAVLERLAANDLVRCDAHAVEPLPALARYALADTDDPAAAVQQLSLFE